MITSLHLENFRGFENHRIPLRKRTIIVGKNNAGKSTVVEALRLVSLITRRYKTQNLRAVPDWLDAAKIELGISPSLQGLQLGDGPLFFHRRSGPASITAEFESGESVKIYVGEKDETVAIHAVFRDNKKKLIRALPQFRKIELPVVGAMSTIGPLRPETRELDEDYVRDNIDTNRASLHFRNQLRLLYGDHFADFKKIAEMGWPTLQVKSLESKQVSLLEKQQKIALIIRESDFSDEVDSMGHGLQVWLQMAWFLARMNKAGCIVLDEPDVYMHADVQRRLIRMLKGDEKRQIIIATHSTEIMPEVEADDILLIDRRSNKSIFANSLPAAQEILQTVGSIHNLSLARLSSARLFLMVEGEDINYLRRLHDTLFPQSLHPVGGLPWMELDGWAGWHGALGIAKMLKLTSSETIKTYCLLDSDYHTDKQLNQKKNEAKKEGLNLKIWARKEIESYLIIPEAIQRIIERKAKATDCPSTEDIILKISEISDSLKDKALEAKTNEFMTDSKELGAGNAAKAALNYINSEWNAGRAAWRVPAKELISSISKWSMEEYKVSISTIALSRELKAHEIDPEIVEFLSAIENVTAL